MFLITTKSKFKLIVCFIVYQIIGASWSAENSKVQHVNMPFKLGYEFQESSSLCKWATNNDKVQKKPMFFLTPRGDNTPLWHLVIDTSDIEFVTRPFCREEIDQVKSCLSSIILSINVLKELLVTNKNITFNDWSTELCNKFTGTSSYLLTFSAANYESIHDKPISISRDNWKPVFCPQVTIQHPLEYTIPLYFSLFGFKSSYMVPFGASLPARDYLLQAQEDADSSLFLKIMNGFQQKTMGFIFLHALTLIQMTPVNEITDSERLQETLKFWNESFQIDAKMMLTLMTRIA